MGTQKMSVGQEVQTQESHKPNKKWFKMASKGLSYYKHFKYQLLEEQYEP